MGPRHARMGRLRRHILYRMIRKLAISLLCLALLWGAYEIHGMDPARSLGSGSSAKLLVSRFPDRSQPASLSGQSVVSPVFVFVTSDAGIRSVRFSIDGETYRIDRSSPFDLNGTAADGSALPWSPSAGAQTITATVRLKNSTQTLTGTIITSTTSTSTTLATATTAAPTTATTTLPAPTTTTVAPQQTCTGVRIAPGSDVQSALNAYSSGASFCLGAGLHRLRSTLVPKDGQIITGEAGAILSGAKLITEWTYDSGNSRWYHTGGTARPAVLSGLCADGTDACKYPDDVWRNNIRLRRVTSLAALGSGGVYIDYGSDRIYVKDDPTNAVMELSATPQALISNANNYGTPDVALSGFVVEKFANRAQQPAVQMGPGWIVDRLEIRRNHGVGVEGGSRSVVRNSHIWGQGQLGLSGPGTVDARVEDNEIDGNNAAGYDAGWEGGGSKWAFTRNLVVRGNYVHDNRGAGLWTDGDNLYTIFEGNKVENNTGPGILHEISYDAVIRNNNLRHNAAAAAGKSIWWGADILLNGSQNVQVYGNRIDSSVNGISLIDTDRGSGRYGTYKVANTDVHDNILALGAGADTGLVGRSSAFQSTANNRFRANTYYVPALTGRSWEWQGSLTKEEWQRYGQDTTGTFLLG
jgi:parallel beta-helix repeat protein